MEKFIGRYVEVTWGSNKGKFGMLVHFGIGYEELRDGIGHYTEAVIVNGDGDFFTVPVNFIRLMRETKG